MQIKNIPVEQVNAFSEGSMAEHLGILVTEIGADYVMGTMPVDHRTHQPMGRLHGGASVALIESLGSIGSSLIVDMEVCFPVGLEVNANHISTMGDGIVEAKAKLVHAGKTTHIWSCDVRNQADQRLISTGRLTVMIVQKKK